MCAWTWIASAPFTPRRIRAGCGMRSSARCGCAKKTRRTASGSLIAQTIAANRIRTKRPGTSHREAPDAYAIVAQMPVRVCHPTRRLRRSLPRVLLLSCFAFGCAPASHPTAPYPTAPHSIASSPAPAFAWTTTLDRDHPLVGRIWDVAHQRFVPRSEVEAAIAKAKYVLLGEKHDNPDHHRLQAEMIEVMARAGRHPVVAMEMLDPGDQAAADASVQTNPTDVDAFFAAVAWDKKGWPAATEYAPIVRVALRDHLPIAAANMSTADTKALIHQGAIALDPDRVARLGLTAPMPKALTDSLREELSESHCGMLPDSMFDPMVLAQHARDAQMADTLLARGKETGAVLIAGTGHVRIDRGVPWELSRRVETHSVSVAFAEVTHGEIDPLKYAAIWHADTLPFTYVWFTPRATDEDPCAGMRKMHAPAASPN